MNKFIQTNNIALFSFDDVSKKDIWKDIKGLKKPFIGTISQADRQKYNKLTSLPNILRLIGRSDRRIKKYLNSLGSIPRTLVIEELW